MLTPTRGYGHRIKMVREMLQYANQTEFAKALHSTQGTVSDWEREETNPREALWSVAHLCEQSDKVFHWLMTGQGFPGISKRGRESREKGR